MSIRGTEATAFFVVSTALAIAALRMFEAARQEPKTRGVHPSFPFFVRMQTLTGFTIWATTCTSGGSTGTTRPTTAALPNEIREGPPTVAVEPREAAPGGTRSRSPALRRARVFRQSSNTPTMVSESRDPRSHEAGVAPRPTCIWTYSGHPGPVALAGHKRGSRR